MKRYHIAVLSLLMAGTGWAQSNITLIADADGCIQENKPTTGSATSRLQCRSYNDGVSVGRQNVTYIRFNLNVLADVPETNAVFSISRDPVKLGSFGPDVVHIYGLLNMAGNTPQQWDEGITYNSSGLEIPGDGNQVTQDIDTNRVVFVADLPGSVFNVGGEIFSISNAALQTFIADRYADDGYMTLILIQEDNANKELYFYPRETSTTNLVPSLFVVGELGGEVIDTNPPSVLVTAPTNGAVDFDITGDVSVQFDEPMDEASITTSTFVLYDALSNSIPATLAYNQGTLTATLDPLTWLDGTATYTAVVSGGAGGVADTNNNVMAADYSWSFTTGETPVLTPPFSLDPDADTWLSNGDGSGPTAKHGTEDLVQIRWHPVRIRMGYVRFDITGVDSALFSDATLSGSFFSGSYNTAGAWDVWGVDDSAAGNNWIESDVSYSTAAGVVNDAPINTFGITNATLLGTITLDGVDPTNGAPIFVSSTTNLDLSAFLTADTDGLVTFIIMSVTNNGFEYRVDSKEGLSTDGHGPIQLNFTAPESPPTPTTINYIAAGSGSSVSLGWDAIANHGYSVERSPALKPASWAPLTDNVVTNTYTDSAPADPSGFYRVIDEGISP